MNNSTFSKRAFTSAFLALTLSTLSACDFDIGKDGLTINEDDSVRYVDAPDTNTRPAETADCGGTTSGVNWGALLNENCPKLSDYNLFADSADPTRNPNAGGIPYDLSTPLFTDYASKYRFVFIPEGEKATYSEHEAFDFPVGTVLVKTFAMPADTANRGQNETIIETRLLIHRENGWVARPYYWDSEADASLAIAGKSVENMTTLHNGQTLTFTYAVPKASSCTSCHSVVPLLQGSDDQRQPIFKPIGPKARYLNKDFDYEGYNRNQLAYWEEQGVLEGLPESLNEVSKAPVFSNAIDPTLLSPEALHDAAKAYLDINCAHCHRSELTLPEPLYAGPAGSSGLQMEYNRNYEDDPTRFGTCKTPVAGGSPDYPLGDVVPGAADMSYLVFRMSTTDPRHKMPELGRSTVHAEGVALISEWINQLPDAACSP